MVEVTLIAAFIAGVISFLSPCVLPIIPGFLAYISGTTIAAAKESRLKIFLNSVFFVLGFAVVFAGLGVLLSTALKGISYDLQIWLSRLGGVVIILFGLYVLKAIKMPFLEREHKLTVRKKFSITYVTSFVFGAAFAVGWTPCVGAVLGSILTLAITNPGMSFALLMGYTIGLGLPFLLVGLFSTEALGAIRKFERFMKYFNIVVGILLILLGILVFTQSLNLVANFGLINTLLLN